ncbi:hypothetical protein [Halobacillus mangrovi]|uniref:hypothetical protein n=1 Tax=Halobacillus mangrovi TaxID=402384 RepID=UPI001E5F784E|nr:hypothetical protein [Halobacillus mangrovi]
MGRCSLQKADVILFLIPSYKKRLWQINLRFIRQKLNIERANYNPGFDMLQKMYQWNRRFEKAGKREVTEKLKANDRKVIALNSNKDTMKYFQ